MNARNKCFKVIKAIRYKLRSRKTIFSEIYHNNSWSGQDSVSGPGSDLSATLVIRQEIPTLIKEVNARTLLDAPCGDFCWMKETELDLDRYIGVDIVPDMIARNRQNYANETRTFVSSDITKDRLPQADVILCRDGLVHLSFKDIFSTIRNFKKSKSMYLLTTTFPQLRENGDIVTGGWRPINLQKKPFSFPKPIKLINEKYEKYSSNGKDSDKSLGLWKLEDISMPKN